MVDLLLGMSEGKTFDVKRAGDNHSKLKTVTAFANTEGGFLIIGIEDSKKTSGRDRVYGIQENPESVDDFKRLLKTRINPQVTVPNSEEISFFDVHCNLRDGSVGTILVVKVPKSYSVHSLVDGGTFIREGSSNRHLNAAEITDLSMQRGGLASAVNALVKIPFDLIDTIYWKEYRDHRQLTRNIDEALFHLGLARKNNEGELQPTMAAVLLFAEEPSGALDKKCSIRIFHYKGDSVEHSVDTNLIRTPKTVNGPLKVQIAKARDTVLDFLSTGVQVSPLGFEIAQKYPVRVITEAITNAVIHRDYRISADIIIRIFANRIEIKSPGVLPGGVTVNNIKMKGSHPRNRAIVDHMREFPKPVNLDAGEGVKMMFETMEKSDLYPPIFLTQPTIESESVFVFLVNQLRPSIWDQVSQYLIDHGSIGNTEVRKILKTDSPIKASKALKNWVKIGLIEPVDESAAKQNRRYRLSGISPDQNLFSKLLGKQLKDS